jgi:hypothetical protein
MSCLVPGDVEIFRAGDLVPASGIYEAHHAPHIATNTIALFKSERFPRCRGCHTAVFFTRVRAIPTLDKIPNLEIKVSLMSLQCPPEITALISARVTTGT